MARATACSQLVALMLLCAEEETFRRRAKTVRCSHLRAQHAVRVQVAHSALPYSYLTIRLLRMSINSISSTLLIEFLPNDELWWMYCDIELGDSIFTLPSGTCMCRGYPGTGYSQMYAYHTSCQLLLSYTNSILGRNKFFKGGSRPAHLATPCA